MDLVGGAEQAGEVHSLQSMTNLHAGGHRDIRSIWARDFPALERSGLPSQTGHQGSLVFLLPCCPTRKCHCSDGNNRGYHPQRWFLFLTAFPSLGGTECFPFNYLTVFVCFYVINNNIHNNYSLSWSSSVQVQQAPVGKSPTCNIVSWLCVNSYNYYY